MVDILESLKTAQRLKEINNTSVIDKNHNLQDGFIKAAKSNNWTQQMIDKFAELVNQQKGKKNNIIDIAFSTLFKDLVAQPQNYGIKPLTGENLNIANRVIKNPYTASQGVKSGKNNGRTNPWEVVIKVEPASTELALTAGNQLQTTNVEKALTNVDKNSIQEYNSDETTNKEKTLNNETPKDEKIAYTGQFIIWPLNPLLPGIKDEFDKIVKAVEKYKGYTVIVTSLNKGGDGQFDIGSFNQFKHHKVGVSFGTSEKNSFSVTSWKTFAKYIIDNQTNSKITENHSKLGISLKLLNEGDSNLVDTKTAQVGNSSIKTNVGDIKFNKNIHIVCSPEMETSMKKDGFLDLLKPLGIDINNCIISDPNLSAPKTIEAGKIIFKTFLEYINGKKAGSAAAQDTTDTLTSQKMNESTSLKEADNPQPDTNDWSWENLKVNTGAKEYISGLYSSVKAIKDGLDDGGNPSMASRVFKQIVTEVGKEWGAALTDGADLMMQGIGLGWMMPLIKAGIETQRNEAPNKEYEGLEALVRSEEFKNLTAYFGDPKAFIEKGAN